MNKQKIRQYAALAGFLLMAIALRKEWHPTDFTMGLCMGIAIGLIAIPLLYKLKTGK